MSQTTTTTTTTTTQPTQEQQQPQLRKPVFSKVESLQPDSIGHNLVLKVVSCNVVVEKVRTDGTKIRIAEAKVGDETGCITLTARNNQIEVVQPGRTIIVRNSRIDMFRGGFMRLAVDKWGKLEAAEQPAPFEVNTDKDLSGIEYELVDDHLPH